MGWIISLVMLYAGCVKDNYILVITSGLFAIAGSLGGAASMIKDAIMANKPTNAIEERPE